MSSLFCTLSSSRSKSVGCRPLAVYDSEHFPIGLDVDGPLQARTVEDDDDASTRAPSQAASSNPSAVALVNNVASTASERSAGGKKKGRMVVCKCAWCLKTSQAGL